MDGVIGFTIIFAGNFAPTGWALCDGRLLPVTRHPILFAGFGNVYGGDGRTTFALPDLRGRAVVGAGQGISNYKHGDMGGIESVLLGTKEIPAHTHPVQVTITPHAATTTNSASPIDAVYGTGNNQLYAIERTEIVMGKYSTQFSTSAAESVQPQPVAVLHPVLALNYIICLTGSFPRRDQ